jgi:2-hydroxycyclohexanecarboxyl-CoA dehydrogenase
VNRIHPKDSLVVITGAGSGIGAAAALLYAKLGATVVAVDINESSAPLTAHACRAGGGNAHGYACDVADASAVDEIAKRVDQVHGPVDVLVNNAGVGVAGPFLDGSLDDWTWLRSVNIDGVIHGCRALGPTMVARGRGHVVHIASGAGYVPNNRMATYCASKAAGSCCRDVCVQTGQAVASASA